MKKDKEIGLMDKQHKQNVFTLTLQNKIILLTIISRDKAKSSKSGA